VLSNSAATYTNLVLGLVLVDAASDPASQGSIRRDGSWIYFTPPASSWSNDVFSFTAGHYLAGDLINSGTGTLTIVRKDVEDLTFTITDFQVVGSNATLRFVGIPLRTYNVQENEDLLIPVWTNVGPVTVQSNGVAVFIRTNAPSPAYYRLLRPGSPD
jgi:hypothetical protein